MNSVKILIILVLILTKALLCPAQYSPAAGMPGSIAVKNDSIAIIGWAVSCTIERGLADMGNPSYGYADFGDELNATGFADGNPLQSVSLGDKGAAVLTFDKPVADKAGYDFAVFENSFTDDFLELAQVAVSSDGYNYFTFPSVSLTDTNAQVTTFGTLATEKIHNLAGKFRAGYGTPFDLADLQNIQSLDLQHITHIRITDVCGSINPLMATRDADGRMINDPYPTPFPTGGFDLDGIGVMSFGTTGIENTLPEVQFSIFPNPATEKITIHSNYGQSFNLKVYDTMGKNVLTRNSGNPETELDIRTLHPGIYFLESCNTKHRITLKFIKQ